MNSVLKTILFLGVMSVILVAVGYLVGGRQMAIWFFGFSVVMNLGSYWFSEKIALKMTKAKKIEDSTSDRTFQHLLADVREVAGRMNLPMPKVYYTDDLQANAFATGRGPKHSSICFTKGILEILTRDELKGVISHELSHIKNRDVLVATIAAVVASAISAFSDAARWFGVRNDERNSGALGFVMTLLVIILGPLVAMLLQMAISRQREFLADESGAKVLGNGEALASALEKIERSTRTQPMKVNSALASLYIGNPLNFMGLREWFSTHPRTEIRTKKLRSIRF